MSSNYLYMDFILWNIHKGRLLFIDLLVAIQDIHDVQRQNYPLKHMLCKLQCNMKCNYSVIWYVYSYVWSY